jgi:hypothetical protein
MEFQPVGAAMCAGWLVELVTLAVILVAGMRARSFVFAAAGAIEILAIVMRLAELLLVSNRSWLQYDPFDPMDPLDLLATALGIASIVLSAGAWICVAIGMRERRSPREAQLRSGSHS